MTLKQLRRAGNQIVKVVKPALPLHVVDVSQHTCHGAIQREIGFNGLQKAIARQQFKLDLLFSQQPFKRLRVSAGSIGLHEIGSEYPCTLVYSGIEFSE